MFKVLVFITVVFISGCASLETKSESQLLEAFYSGLRFKIPPNPLLVGYLDGGSDTLIVKYSDKPGTKYIGISNEKGLATGGCDPSVFFKTAVGVASERDCQGAVAIFQKIFSRDSEVGIWSGAEHEFYYFIGDPGRSRSSFMFYVKDNGKIIKFESDFMKTEEFRKAVEEYL